MSKYGSRKTEIDGITFDSQAEARRYQELKLLEYAGEIRALVLQPRYELQAAFMRDGRKVSAITYVGDFEFFEGDQRICEDVKGVRTDAFELKRRLFLRRYPDIELRITE